MKAEPPTNLVCHPVSNARTGILIEQKGLKRFFGVLFDESTDPCHGEPGILWLRRKFRPRVGDIMEHDATKHAVVVENERGMLGLENEVVVFLGLVVSGCHGEFSGHAKMNFEMEPGCKSEEHSLPVSAR